MRRVQMTESSFGKTNFESDWLLIEKAIRDSGAKVYGLADPLSLPTTLGTVTFDEAISSDSLAAIELIYGDISDSQSPRVSVTTIWNLSLRTVGNADRIDPDPDYLGVGVDYGGVRWDIEAKGSRHDWSGFLQIDDLDAGIRISVEASQWAEGRVRLTVVEDIEQLLELRRELIRSHRNRH